MLEAMIKDCSVIMSDYCNDVTEYIQGNIEESICNLVLGKDFLDTTPKA